MLNTKDILETINMIREEHLDVRTITMGISLLDCQTGDNKETCRKIYDKITKRAEKLVESGCNIEKEYGDERFPDLQMCGKIGTAQITGATSHSWFVGYSQREDLPLAVVCIAENAGSGMKTAVNVSNEVMQYFSENK
jgi:beta-lactamase class D